MIPEEQIKNIKKQLLEQLEKANLPNKEQVKTSIQAMNAEQLEQFLIQNNLVKVPEGAEQQTQCIFCSIAQEQVPSYKIDENDKAIAVLEINPISKGHIIVIPKEHIENKDKLPKEVQELAEKISKKIKEELKPKDIQILPSVMMNHTILNVLPIYKDENLNSKRNQASEEELKELQKQLVKKPEKPKKVEIKKTEEIITDKNFWLPKRIP